MMGDMGAMMGSMYLWAILWLFLLAAATAGVIALVITLGRRAGRPDAFSAPSPTEEARDILRRRYAAGEIDEDEYLRRLSGIAQRLGGPMDRGRGSGHPCRRGEHQRADATAASSAVMSRGCSSPMWRYTTRPAGSTT